MLKTQSGKRQREKLKNARATARSMHTNLVEGHVREAVDEPAHDFRMKGAIGKGTLLETVFHVREAGYEVEKRIVESRKPLVRTTTSTASDSYYNHPIPIPQRPKWDGSKMTAEEVATLEDEDFERYLQGLYDAYPPTRLNHFEHNLHVWKQLWRVVDISDILVLVADARHPQFHVPPSLYDYIVNVMKKPMVVILNKIDFISSKTLADWIADFAVRFPLLTVVPFSSFPHEKTITNPEADTVQESKRKAVQHERNRAGGAKTTPYGVDNLLKVLEEIYRVKQQKEQEFKETHAAATGGDDPDAPTPAQLVDPNWRPSRVKNKKAAFAKARQDADALSLDIVKNVDLMKELKGMNLDVDVAKQAAEREAAAAAAAAAAPSGSKAAKDAQLYSEGASPSMAPADAPVVGADASSILEGEENEAADADEPAIAAAVAAASSAAAASASSTSGLHKNPSKITVGTIGHPNVGKSSLINALFGRPVVTVSETPGKTKHLQTLSLNDKMELCDCPGLVFAAVDMPRALQVLCGIFPISQLREPYTSVQYLASRIALEKIYGLVPPTVQGILAQQGIDTSGASVSSALRSSASKSGAGRKKKSDLADASEDQSVDMFAELQIQEAEAKASSYVWSAWDICEAYAKARNYSIKGSKGLVDTQRAANDILHDALSGVVLLTFSPPKRAVPLGAQAEAAVNAAAAADSAASAAAPTASVAQ